jgi:hypothetical protein
MSVARGSEPPLRPPGAQGKIGLLGLRHGRRRRLRPVEYDLRAPYAWSRFGGYLDWGMAVAECCDFLIGIPMLGKISS